MLLHYRLLKPLGAGGMGVVWKAIDTTLEREVAIKILPEAFAADPERLARFEREAKVLASLNHPNIEPCTACTKPKVCDFSRWSSFADDRSPTKSPGASRLAA